MRHSLTLVSPGAAIPTPVDRAAGRSGRILWLPRRTRKVFVLALVAMVETLGALVFLTLLSAFAAPSLAHAPTLRSPMAASVAAPPAQALAPLSER